MKTYSLDIEDLPQFERAGDCPYCGYKGLWKLSLRYAIRPRDSKYVADSERMDFASRVYGYFLVRKCPDCKTSWHMQVLNHKDPPLSEAVMRDQDRSEIERAARREVDSIAPDVD